MHYTKPLDVDRAKPVYGPLKRNAAKAIFGPPGICK